MVLVKEGYVSLHSFVLGFLMIVIYLLCTLYKPIQIYLWFLYLLYIFVINFVVQVMFKQNYEVAIRGLGLGLAMSIGITLSLSNSSFQLFGWYIAALSFFHWSEYFTTAYTNPKNLSLQSYLLDHSTEYQIAATVSTVEFFIEWYFFQDFKQPNIISLVGLVLVFGGEFLRKVSMYTAATNFNHYVQYAKSSDHKLVTHGVYGYFRHPAYVGWFYWSIGTQLMICNPICFIGYAYISWKFFNSRIHDEELALLSFFNEEYLEYQRKVPTGIPFISGFKIE